MVNCILKYIVTISDEEFESILELLNLVFRNE